MANNVLYIEDNPDNMMLVQRALEARGYRLLKAANGLDGVATAAPPPAGATAAPWLAPHFGQNAAVPIS